MTVAFGLLGRVTTEIDGRPAEIGHARQRLVLAALLVDANRPLAPGQLIDRVWGEAAPAAAIKTLRSYLARLRTALDRAPAEIERDAGGYRLVVEDEQDIDARRFARLVAEARATADRAAAAELFSRALGLWRGEALAGLDSSWAEEVRGHLAQQRAAAERDHADLALQLGRHAELLPELLAGSHAQPLDERLAGQLMLALYRTGRQSEALAHYRRLREHLAAELGTGPGTALEQLHHRILTNDPRLAVREPAAEPSPKAAVPRQLPAPPAWFTGRDGELAALSAAFAAAREAGTVGIAALSGAGGIGKTALALHWAHGKAAEFPDGQLYANLRGFEADASPVSWTSVLRGFLHALGVPGDALPADVDAQVALYRSTIAGKRILVVLDNARETAQVAPFLPGDPACAVLVTSRDRLAGLVASHGAHPLRLDVLPPSTARALLGKRVGDGRLEQDAAAAAKLLQRCAGFPLALSILAGRLAAQPTLSLASLSDGLAAFDDGEPGASLPAVLSWSFTALTEKQARVAELLGQAPGPDIAVPAAANLCDLPPAETDTILRALERVSLVQDTGSGRYRMHDLVRLYAAGRTGPDPAAQRRLLDFYTGTALAGNTVLHPHGVLVKTGAPEPGQYPHPHPLPDRAAVLAWFDAEHANLLAAQRSAAEHGLQHTVWRLAWALTAYHHGRARLHDDLAVCQAAADAAGELTETAVQVVANRRLGLACARVGRHDEAESCLHRALVLAERAGDVSAQAIIEHNLAQAWELRGQDRQALAHAVRALRRFETLGNPVWHAQALNGVGWYLTRLGEHDEARVHCEQALALYREQGHVGAADALDSLGLIAHHTGRHADALDRYHEALVVYRDSGNTYMEADTLDHLGRTYAALGEHGQAREVWQRAQDLYRAQGRTGRADGLTELMETPAHAR
ncbi:AfsR/SARP family transcriptional regulator [Amycolatopsis sp. WGS_07]|uniref:AfsR/SARP family transcriptional regulator n=1 Tax=Amycolatopsis sp. WGS_07 TaxID=3076764 RepID=UPI0038739E8A